MTNLDLILFVFALVLAVLASAGVNHPRFQTGWAAFACFVATYIFS